MAGLAGVLVDQAAIARSAAQGPACDPSDVGDPGLAEALADHHQGWARAVADCADQSGDLSKHVVDTVVAMATTDGRLAAEAVEAVGS